ncbi:MAG: 6-phosphogluconolactonase, partial [Chthoniobacterales bacterium]
MKKPDVIHSKDFVADAVALIEGAAKEAFRERGEFRLALAGGNTPKPVYAALAKTGIDWSRVVITFGDERCVEPTDADSNYRMTCESLLNQVSIPEENVLRMAGEGDPADAAAAYEAELRKRAG